MLFAISRLHELLFLKPALPEDSTQLSFPQKLLTAQRGSPKVDVEARAKGRAKEKESHVESQEVRVHVEAEVEGRALLHLLLQDLYTRDLLDARHLPSPNLWIRTSSVSDADRKAAYVKIARTHLL